MKSLVKGFHGNMVPANHERRSLSVQSDHVAWPSRIPFMRHLNTTWRAATPES